MRLLYNIYQSGFIFFMLISQVLPFVFKTYQFALIYMVLLLLVFVLYFRNSSMYLVIGKNYVIGLFTIIMFISLLLIIYGKNHLLGFFIGAFSSVLLLTDWENAKGIFKLSTYMVRGGRKRNKRMGFSEYMLILICNIRQALIDFNECRKHSLVGAEIGFFKKSAEISVSFLMHLLRVGKRIEMATKIRSFLSDSTWNVGKGSKVNMYLWAINTCLIILIVIEVER